MRPFEGQLDVVVSGRRKKYETKSYFRPVAGSIKTSEGCSISFALCPGKDKGKEDKEGREKQTQSVSVL